MQFHPYEPFFNDPAEQINYWSDRQWREFIFNNEVRDMLRSSGRWDEGFIERYEEKLQKELDGGEYTPSFLRQFDDQEYLKQKRKLKEKRMNNFKESMGISDELFDGFINFLKKHATVDNSMSRKDIGRILALTMFFLYQDSNENEKKEIKNYIEKMSDTIFHIQNIREKHNESN